MSLLKVILDTNPYIDWMNDGLREDVMAAPGFVRYLSAVVQMELRVGTADRDFEAVRRVLDCEVEIVKA